MINSLYWRVSQLLQFDSSTDISYDDDDDAMFECENEIDSFQDKDDKSDIEIGIDMGGGGGGVG